MKLMHKVTSFFKNGEQKQIHLRTSDNNVYVKKYKVFLDTFLEGIIKSLQLTKKAIEGHEVFIPDSEYLNTYANDYGTKSFMAYVIGEQATITGLFKLKDISQINNSFCAMVLDRSITPHYDFCTMAYRKSDGQPLFVNITESGKIWVWGFDKTFSTDDVFILHTTYRITQRIDYNNQ